MVRYLQKIHLNLIHDEQARLIHPTRRLVFIQLCSLRALQDDDDGTLFQ